MAEALDACPRLAPAHTACVKQGVPPNSTQLLHNRALKIFSSVGQQVAKLCFHFQPARASDGKYISDCAPDKQWVAHRWDYTRLSERRAERPHLQYLS